MAKTADDVPSAAAWCGTIPICGCAEFLASDAELKAFGVQFAAAVHAMSLNFYRVVGVVITADIQELQLPVTEQFVSAVTCRVRSVAHNQRLLVASLRKKRDQLRVELDRAERELAVLDAGTPCESGEPNG